MAITKDTLQAMIREGRVDEALTVFRVRFADRSSTLPDCLEGASPQEVAVQARLETDDHHERGGADAGNEPQCVNPTTEGKRSRRQR